MLDTSTATNAPATIEPRLYFLKCAQIVGDVRIFRRQRFEVADFDVDFFYAGPFRARAKKPASLTNDAGRVESITRNEKLHALACSEIRTYDGALACSIFVQHKNFNRITQVTVIELIVAYAMESYRRIRRHHEIECGARWPTIQKRCWQSAGRDSLIADKCDTNETARGVRLEFEQSANLFSTQIIGHRI